MAAATVFDLLVPSPAKPLFAAAAAAFAIASAPAASASDAALRSTLARAMGSAGPWSSAYVYDATDRRAIFRRRAGYSRILASNTKLFTSAAALDRLGEEAQLRTEVVGVGYLDLAGVWQGDLYLRGGGDPTFGSRRFVERSYRTGATVEALAAAIQKAGVVAVTGRVYGDESRFDARRGGPDSAYRTSIWVGPLSALAYNRGLARESGAAFQSNPPLFAATRLDAALERLDIPVARKPRAGTAPEAAAPLASVDSPPVGRLLRLMNKPSDNFFAEMLLKDVGATRGRIGTTPGGARVAARVARRLGSRARLVDGSGLSRADRASPYRIVRLLLAMRRREDFPVFFGSLPVAGRDGTLATRMRRGPARGRCRGKTGTLSNVSALSGYCTGRSGDVYAFSILMNGVFPIAARKLQDRMANAIAGRG